MSKTDKTRPWWVRMGDTPMATCVPVHDHRFGPCTLPDEISAGSASPSRRTGVCYWGSPAHCALGCLTRGGNREWYHFRRETRRRSRHEARDSRRGLG